MATKEKKYDSINEQMRAHSREMADVMTERNRQLNKFGPQNRPPYQWFLILSEEVGEVAKECVEIEFDDAKHPYADPERYYKELTEVAAVALAAMQNFNQRRPQCFHDPEDGGCSLCSRPAPEGMPRTPPTDEELVAALCARFGTPTRGSVQVVGRMPFQDGTLQFQAHVSGFTDWYTVKFDAAGKPDYTTIEQLPF